MPPNSSELTFQLTAVVGLQTAQDMTAAVFSLLNEDATPMRAPEQSTLGPGWVAVARQPEPGRSTARARTGRKRSCPPKPGTRPRRRQERRCLAAPRHWARDGPGIEARLIARSEKPFRSDARARDLDGLRHGPTLLRWIAGKHGSFHAQSL